MLMMTQQNFLLVLEYSKFPMMWNIKGLLLVTIIKKKLYHIFYEDRDAEDFYHNEVKDICAGSVK